MALIYSFSPIFTILTPWELENGMDLGEMLLHVITVYHGHQKKTIEEEKYTWKQREVANFLILWNFLYLMAEIPI